MAACNVLLWSGEFAAVHDKRLFLTEMLVVPHNAITKINRFASGLTEQII